tara:strand:- start:6412 stop:7188 length:777 start_codon:yes stop_codon:yes gene_type:complete
MRDLGMKLKPLDEFFYTSCKKCKFADYKEETQVGCKADMWDFFGEDMMMEAYDNEKEFNVIKTSCFMCVPESVDATVEDVREVVSKTTFAFLLFLEKSDIESEGIDDKVFKTIGSLEKLNFDKEDFKFIISHPHDIAKDDRLMVSKWLQRGHESGLRITVMVNGYKDTRDKDTFSHVKYAQYICLLNPGSTIRKSGLKDISDHKDQNKRLFLSYACGKLSFTSMRALSIRYYESEADVRKTVKAVAKECKDLSLFAKV